jgi:hypothetical protein
MICNGCVFLKNRITSVSGDPIQKYCGARDRAEEGIQKCARADALGHCHDRISPYDVLEMRREYIKIVKERDDARAALKKARQSLKRCKNVMDKLIATEAHDEKRGI